jgi:type IV secretion system protein VirD4
MTEDQNSILAGFPRGDPAKQPRDYTAPAARFADPELVRTDSLAAWKPGKLFLGLLGGRVTGSIPDHHIMGGHAVGVADNRHICTFAGSRSGKGRAVIVPNMLHYPGSVLATDPKGELATMTARQRVALGQKVHVLDPFGETKGYPQSAGLITGFNPILSMRDGRLVEDAALISDALVVVGGKDPHWDESARTLIEGVILHVRTWDDYKDRRSLLTVRELVGTAGKNDELAAAMRKNTAAGGVVQASAADFFDRPPNERGSVLSSARRHLKFIDLFRDNQTGRDTLEKNGFNLDELKTRPTTVYLCLPARHIGTCNRWLRLFVNLTLQSMERTQVERLPAGIPILCVLDEFASLGHMKQIEDAAGQIAGFGVRLWPILQDLGQLKSLYSERWETFLGNAGVIQFFGNNDLTTLEWISKRCGRTAVSVRTDRAITVEQRRAGAAGESWSTEMHDLLTVEEAGRLFSRDDAQLRQLILWGGLPPIVLQRAHYDTHRLFRDDNGKLLFDELPAFKGAEK